MIGLIAGLAVEAFHARQLCNFGVNQSLRQGEAIFVGECHQRSLVEQCVEQGVKVADNACVIGIRPPLARLLQPVLQGVAHLTLVDFLVADLDQRSTAHSQPEIAGAKIGKVGEREAREDSDQHDGYDPCADFGF